LESELGGLPLHGFFSFDTDVRFTFSSPTENVAIGGTRFGFPSPLLADALTINGHSVSVGGPYDAEIVGINDGHHAQIDDKAAENAPPGGNVLAPTSTSSWSK
jgi:hypothetical protein